MLQDVISAQVVGVGHAVGGHVDQCGRYRCDGLFLQFPGQQLYVMVPDQSTVDLAKDMIQSTLNGS